MTMLNLSALPSRISKAFRWLPCLCAAMLLTAAPVHADEELLVADMEGKTEFTAFPQTDSPKADARLVDITAASGKRSIRFDFDGNGEIPGSLVIPFEQPIGEYDVLAFDLFVQSQNGTNLTVTVHPQTTDETIKTTTSYISRVDLRDGRDGWFPIHLTKNRSLFKRSPEKEENWDNPRAISFAINKTGQGKVVFFIDNVRFLKADKDLARNMMYNGSFEIATNPDTPDGWRRNFFPPPYGPTVWTRDTTEKWHGQSSLRLGNVDVIASAWTRYFKLIPKNDYTMSVYLKADRPDLEVELGVNGLSAPNNIAQFKVGTEWARYTLTGNAYRALTSTIITQKSPGVLWIDAVQLEEGTEPTEYFFPKYDQQELEARATSVPMLPSSLHANPVSTKLIKLTKAPVLDGKLDDACWQGVPGMTNFKDVEVDTDSPTKTKAWIAYDDEAFYLAIRAMEPDMARLRKALDGARSAWSADVLEVFFDTNNDRTSYYQFAINANNSVWYSHAKAPRQRTAWYADWTTAAKMNDDSWTVEIRIPFTTFKPGELGETFGLNVGRTLRVGEGKGDSTYSAWSFPHAAFGQPRAFGKVTGFDTSVLQPYQVHVVSSGWNQNTARARLENKTGKPVTLNAVFQTQGDKPFASKTINVSLADGEIKDITAPLAVDKDGSYDMRLLVTDTSGKHITASQPATFIVSGANQFVFDGSKYNLVIQGQPIELRSTVNVPADKIKGHRIQWTAGKKKGELDAKPGVNEWTIDSANLPAGELVVKASLVKNDAAVQESESTFRLAPPSEQIVRINRWGKYFEVNGETFMPFGFFTEALFRATDLETWREILMEMKRNDCTSVIAYMGLSTTIDESLGKYLDVADEVGIKVFVEISSYFTWHIPKVRHIKNRYNDKESAMAGLKATLTKYRTHPAVLGWCAFDEPTNRPDIFTSEVIAEASKAIKELDPYHPFFCTHLNQLGDAEKFGPSVDVGMMPFLASGGRYDAMFRELSAAGLPVMTNSPVYGAAGNAKHEPSIAQHRVNTYKAIIMGSAGIQYYLFRPASQMLYDSMGDISRELQQLKPALFNANPHMPIQVTSENPDIMAVLKYDGKNYYLLMINTGGMTSDVTVDLLSLKSVQSVEPIFGSPSADHQGTQARLAVTVPGTSTAFYRINASK